MKNKDNNNKNQVENNNDRKLAYKQMSNTAQDSVTMTE